MSLQPQTRGPADQLQRGETKGGWHDGEVGGVNAA